jgi:pyruvate dehydrogenase (quinone)
LLGKDVLPDDLPYVTGAIGLLGTRPSYELMMGCDTFLMIGSNFPYGQFLPKFGQARGIQIDIDGSMIGMRYPTELNIVSDAAAALDEIIPLLERKTDRSWREKTELNVSHWWETMERQSMLKGKPINPMRISWELSSRLPDNVILTADSGSSTNWYARCLKFRDGMRGSLSGTLATMGPGVPYAIGAKFAHPDRPVIAMVGDGAMQMNGLAECLTIKRYHHEWPDPRLIICVHHNNDLNQVTWELRAMAGSPKFEESQVLPDVSYADVAKMMGLHSIAVDDPDQVGPAWDEALAADRPTVLDIRCDPEMPPIPPHATYEQAKELTTSILKGDPEALHIMTMGLKAKAQEFVPDRG